VGGRVGGVLLVGGSGGGGGGRGDRSGGGGGRDGGVVPGHPPEHGLWCEQQKTRLVVVVCQTRDTDEEALMVLVGQHDLQRRALVKQPGLAHQRQDPLCVIHVMIPRITQRRLLLQLLRRTLKHLTKPRIAIQEPPIPIRATHGQGRRTLPKQQPVRLCLTGLCPRSLPLRTDLREQAADELDALGEDGGFGRGGTQAHRLENRLHNGNLVIDLIRPLLLPGVLLQPLLQLRRFPISIRLILPPHPRPPPRASHQTPFIRTVTITPIPSSPPSSSTPSSPASSPNPSSIRHARYRRPRPIPNSLLLLLRWYTPSRPSSSTCRRPYSIPSPSSSSSCCCSCCCTVSSPTPIRPGRSSSSSLLLLLLHVLLSSSSSSGGVVAGRRNGRVVIGGTRRRRRRGVRRGAGGRTGRVLCGRREGGRDGRSERW